MTATSEYVVDSSAWIEYFRGSEKGKKIKTVIETQHLSTNTIAIAEIVSTFVKNNINHEKEVKFIENKSTLLMSGPGLCELAGTLKVQHRKQHPKFGLIDAIHLATAIQQKAVLLTTDTDFAGIKNVMLI